MWRDGWMLFNFTSFSTVFQSYQGDSWDIVKGCVQRNHVYDLQSPFLKRGSNPGQLDMQASHLTYWATGAPNLVRQTRITVFNFDVA